MVVFGRRLFGFWDIFRVGQLREPCSFMLTPSLFSFLPTLLACPQVLLITLFQLTLLHSFLRPFPYSQGDVLLTDSCRVNLIRRQSPESAKQDPGLRSGRSSNASLSN